MAAGAASILILFSATNAFANVQLSAARDGVRLLGEAAQEMTCTANQATGDYYTQPAPPAPSVEDTAKKQGCDRCKVVVNEQKTAMTTAVDTAVTQDGAAAAQGRTGAENAVIATTAAQRGTQGGAGSGYGVGSSAQAARARIAQELATAARNCEREINDGCPRDENALIQVDRAAKAKAIDGCKKIGTTATAAAAARTSEGSALSGLGDLTRALGMAMQAMQGMQPQSNSNPSGTGSNPYSDITATSPTPDSLNTSTIGGTETGNGTNGGNTVGFGDPTQSSLGKIGDGTKVGSSLAAGSTTGRAAGSGTAGKSPFATTPGTAFGGNGEGSNAGANANGSGALGGGSLANASGASRAQDYVQAGKAGGAEGGEYNMAGGKALLGLRSRSDGGGDLDNPAGLAAAFGGGSIEDAAGERNLASEEAPAGEQLQQASAEGEGASLFLMVRYRYAEIKRSGRL